MQSRSCPCAPLAAARVGELQRLEEAQGYHAVFPRRPPW